MALEGRLRVGETPRGSMAIADQANACVSSSTTPLNTHKRLGPAGATPGVGNVLKRRPGVRLSG